jgi:hypothetical protein
MREGAAVGFATICADGSAVGIGQARGESGGANDAHSNVGRGGMDDVAAGTGNDYDECGGACDAPADAEDGGDSRGVVGVAAGGDDGGDEDPAADEDDGGDGGKETADMFGIARRGIRLGGWR